MFALAGDPAERADPELIVLENDLHLPAIERRRSMPSLGRNSQPGGRGE